MKLLLPIALGSAMLVAGCAYYQHDHDAADGHHGNDHHSNDQYSNDHHGQMQGHHEQMMEGHHDGMNDGHGGHMMGGHAHSGESLAGKPGKASDVSRVIEVIADDSMRFSHESLNIKDGETIKFVITNKGQVPHEFSIATKDEHMEHGQMMRNNPNMHHGPGGNTVTVKPGETLELLWMFENAWQIEVACNIPGHYEAGMHSPVTIGK